MTNAPLPPENLDAEENVLGAILLAGSGGPETSANVLAAIRATGLVADDFSRRSHGLVYEAALAAADNGEPTTALALERELRARRELTAAGGKKELIMLAGVVPAMGNAAHFARLVVDAAERREQDGIGLALRAAAQNGGIWEDDALRERIVNLIGHRRSGSAQRLLGSSNEDVLGLDVPPTKVLVADVVEAGTVGTIAGLPETFKSWLAVEIAHKVAAGGSSVLGRLAVLQPGPVGYWWQDDSIENEVRRVQAYAGRHGYERALPIRWHLNEGLLLPDDLPRLREEIEREQQVLACLDSLYNFLRGVTMKDEEVGQIYAAIKTDVCDQTGATVCVVDHSPWPTEGNRDQRRAYGTVFKAAAIRWGIYLVAEGDSLYAEARGNNVVGLPRTPVMFDRERLELRILEAPSQEVDLNARIADFLRRNVGAATHVVVAGVTGDDGQIRRRLNDSEAFVTLPPVLFAKPRNTKCWANAEDAPTLLSTTSVDEATDVAPTLARETNDNLGGATSPPERGRSRTDVGLSSSVEAAPGSTDDAAEGGRKE